MEIRSNTLQSLLAGHQGNTTWVRIKSNFHENVFHALRRKVSVLRDPSGEPFDHFGTIGTMQDDNKYVMLYKIKQR